MSAAEPLEGARFPDDFVARPGRHVVGGRRTVQHVRKDAYTRVRVFVDMLTGVPLSVTDEYRSDEAAALGVGGGGYEAVMTWTWEHMRIGPLDAAVFELPAAWTHARCKRHVGGWPYIHLFHHYMKI